MKITILVEKHKEIGNELKKIQDYLRETGAFLYYDGHVRGRINNNLRRAENYLNQVQTELEDEMFKEHPSLRDEEGFGVYYGLIKE